MLYHRDNTDVNIAKKVAEQTASLAHYGVAHYVLTNAANQQDSDNLHIVRTDLFEHYPKLTLYFYRILMAFDFLQAHPEIEKAALTDAGDVKMLNYPFDVVEDGILYMGDETIFIYDTSILIGYDGPQFIKGFIWEKWSFTNFEPRYNGRNAGDTNRVSRNYGQTHYGGRIKFSPRQ